MKRLVLSIMAAAMAISTTGCAGDAVVNPESQPTTALDGSKYLLGTEPEDASSVIDVRQKAQDGDHVVIAGRIGGSATPFVDGRAAFSIVDASLKSCLECGSDECPKPWDYC